LLKLAVIGCGRIAQTKHSEAIIKNSDIIENVAVCDLKEERAEQFASKVENSGLKKPDIYTDYGKLLKRTDVDAVAIATESGKHYELTLAALQNNKHVLVEKPMALSTKHMNEMIEFAKKKNLKLGVCFQNRFNPPIQELRKKITTNSFGRILHGQASIRWNRNEEYYKQAKWRGTWEYDGGTLMNQCTHNIDLLLWNMGSEINEIYGVIQNFTHPYIEAEDFGGAIIKFKNGSVGIIEGSANIYPKNLEETLSIFGEKGTVVIGGLAVNKIKYWRFEGEDGHPFQNLPDPDTVYGSGHIPLYRDFYHSIEEDREPFINGEEGKKAVEAVLGIYKSALLDRPVKFPIDFSTTELKGDIHSV
jgi:predicted dehydrogenase